MADQFTAYKVETSVWVDPQPRLKVYKAETSAWIDQQNRLYVYKTEMSVWLDGGPATRRRQTTFVN
jgi:hypothetical protein